LCYLIVVLELCYYFTGDGQSPFEDWFSGLDTAAAAKVAAALVPASLGT
jgi:hypothetical protein